MREQDDKVLAALVDECGVEKRKEIRAEGGDVKDLLR